MTTTAPTTTSRRFDQWLFDNYDDVTDDSLAVVRILYAGVFLLFMQPEFTWIESFTDSFFFPPIGPFLVLPGFPPGPFFVVVEIVLSVSLVAVALGWRTGWASLVTTLTLLAGFGFTYSFGKIDHTIFVVLAPTLLAAAGWGRRWSLDERAGRVGPGPAARWPLVVLMVLLGWMFFSSGIQKLANGWLDPTVQSTRGHHLNHLIRGDDALLAVRVAELDNRVLYELMDVGTVLLECAGLVAVVSRRWFRNFLATVAIFHLSILAVLNIPFWGNLIPYLAFFPVSVAPRPGRWLDAVMARLPSVGGGAVVAGVGAVAAVVMLAVGPPGTALLDAIGIGGEILVTRSMLAAGAVLGAWWLARELLGWMSGLRRRGVSPA